MPSQQKNEKAKGKLKPKKRDILVNSNPFEARLAVVEDNSLVELYVERAKDRGITGNIYKGTIVRVLPGMQAAFVEVGLDRTAFLHVSDIKEDFDDLDDEEDDEFREDKKEDGKEAGDKPGGASKEAKPAPKGYKAGRGRGGRPDKDVRIQDLVKEGQTIMVQVAKEPIGTKGARVTSYVSLPGRYLVLMPTYTRIGVSRRIQSDKERRRLRSIVKGLRGDNNYGFIVRTVCDGVSKEDIQADMDFLVMLWHGILERAEKGGNPIMLFEELDLTLRTIRDTMSRDVSKFVIDSKEEYDRAMDFTDNFVPELRGKIELYKGSTTLFDSHGIELELQNAIEVKVWLKSGGHIVIDQMEALTAIDVNTGKFVGKKNSEDTILKTNLEAIKEIVRQVRLRNIGGIIVCDFIDMTIQANKEKVYRVLKDALRSDKARTNILKVSELGLVEMTRKRTRESIAQSLCEPCPLCEGNGLIKAKDTVIMEIYRELLTILPKKWRKAVVYVSPVIADRIDETPEVLDNLRKKFKKKIVIKPIDEFTQEEFEIV